MKLVSRSLASATTASDDDCATSDVNDSGLVVFDSLGTNLAAAHRGNFQIYTGTGNSTVQRISESAPGVAMDSSMTPVPGQPSITNSGHVVFLAFASDLPGFNLNSTGAIYRRTLNQSPGIQLVSAKPANPAQSVGGFIQQPSISDDGRYVAYTWVGTPLGAGDLPSDSADPFLAQVYRRDCDGPATAIVFVSEGSDASSGGGSGAGSPCLSADGRYVVFATSEGYDGQVPNGANILIRRDCTSFARELVSRTQNGRMDVSVFTWPSLAANNPTLCHFYSDQYSDYQPPTGQAYMTYVP